MTAPHIYLSHGLVIRATPISQTEFEELSQSKAFKKPDKVIYLKDASISGSQGKIAELGFLVLGRSSVDGVGRSSIKLSSSIST